MADIRTIATVVEAYSVDVDNCPSPVTFSALASLVKPAYVRELPQKDPWGEASSHGRPRPRRGSNGSESRQP